MAEVAYKQIIDGGGAQGRILGGAQERILGGAAMHFFEFFESFKKSKKSIFSKF